jgi:TolA-binding protein
MRTDFGRWSTASASLKKNSSDTEMTAGSEAYQAALVFYKSVKMAAAQDVPGAKAVYEELKTRFPGGKRKAGETETET